MSQLDLHADGAPGAGQQVRPAPAGGPACYAGGCERDAVAKALCMKHYKRQWAGLPLLPAEPAIGSPSGLGAYGVLDDDGDSVLCHECGRRFASVGAHLAGAHGGMRAREYKRAHGLAQGTALISAKVSQALSTSSLARVEAATPAWLALEAARDPVAAAAARTGEDLARRGEGYAAVAAANIARGPSARRPDRTCPMCARPYTPEPGRAERHTCGRAQCLAALRAAAASRPRHVQRDRAIAAAHAGGASVAELGERYDLGTTRVRQIITRSLQAPSGEAGRRSSVQTLTLSLDGAAYVLDLDRAGAARLRADVAAWVAGARRPPAPGPAPPRPGSGDAAAVEGGAGAVRAWARKSGHHVAARGRISAKLVAAYQDAHP